MRRFSIARLMLVVAFLAANFAIVRYFAAADDFDHLLAPFVLGILPLLDAQAIALYMASTRYRLALRRRAIGDRPYVATFAACCVPVLLATMLAMLVATTSILGLLESGMDAVVRRLSFNGQMPGLETPMGRYLVGPIYLGAALSGPPLLLAAALAAALSRFRLDLTPRPEPPCADSRSSA